MKKSIKVWGGAIGTFIVIASTLASMFFEGKQTEAEQQQNNEEIADLVVAKLNAQSQITEQK